jgi:RNA polymerase sigma-70 factor (ECF subfamily)
MTEAISPSLAPEQFRCFLEQFRPSLLREAEKQWDGQLRPDDPSDLVQMTVMEALRKENQFKGTTEAELACWLRQILTNIRKNVKRGNSRVKRNPKRTRSLQEILGESSACLQAGIAAEQSSPSKQAAKKEELTRLLESLAKLPDDQREAVTLHHVEGLPNAEVARRMERTEASVAGLIYRGIVRLGELMENQE